MLREATGRVAGGVVAEGADGVAQDVSMALMQRRATVVQSG